MQIKVEKNVPMPKKYPFDEMDVGSSFLVPPEVNRATLTVAASRYGKPLGKKFSIRKTPDGFRCWRLQ